MSYVRLLMTEESAVPTLRCLGHWGHMDVVDLSASASSAASPSLSDRVVRLKKRIASAQYWEKRLEGLRDLMPSYGLHLPTLEDIEVGDTTVGDVVDASTAFLEPLEAALSAHILFQREQQRSIGLMTEQMAVLDAVLHPGRKGHTKDSIHAIDGGWDEEKERSLTSLLSLPSITPWLPLRPSPVVLSS